MSAVVYPNSRAISAFHCSSAQPRAFEITDAGSKFLDDIIPVRQMAEAVLQRAGAAGRVEEGTVRIDIITTLAGRFLRELIASYRRCFPGGQLDIHDGGRRNHVRAIRARQLDTALFTGNTPIEGCDNEELWRERVHVTMAVHHPLASSFARKTSSSRPWGRK